MRSRLVVLSAMTAALSAAAAVSAVPAMARSHAAPRVLLSADCQHGLVATLSNLNGTHRARFHVTGPSGHTSVVSVRPDAAKRVFFPVDRGVSGTLHVRVSGMQRTLRWTNTCRK